MSPFGLTVRRFDSDSSLFEEVVRVRYDVYTARGFLTEAAYPDRRETDVFDEKSQHIGVYQDGQLLAYSRFILGRREGVLPICETHPVSDLARIELIGEVSRFIVSNHGSRFGFLPSKLLVWEIYQLSLEHGLSHVVALIEVPLLRMLRHRGWPFKPVAEARWHMGGMTLPTVCAVTAVDPAKVSPFAEREALGVGQ
jgi:N-acyl-L-homoserine lactone synthetase